MGRVRLPVDLRCRDSSSLLPSVFFTNHLLELASRFRNLPLYKPLIKHFYLVGGLFLFLFLRPCVSLHKRVNAHQSLYSSLSPYLVTPAFLR